MLRLDLARLGREGSVLVDAQVPPDDPLLKDLDVVFQSSVEVHLRASHAGSGEVVVRGTLEAALRQECRRCLEAVPSRLFEEVTMVFVPSSTPGAEDDGDVRVFEEGAAQLDLEEPVLEEMILGIDRYVVCSPECKGLCPRCGVNRNVDSCDCTEDGTDPRWDALRALKEE
jgi:uncharacterized protein